MNRLPALFDANAGFGKAATGAADCPTIRARLAHMDRLGIGRALVWNVESRQVQALSSNQRLLGELADTPGAAGRIIPALAVSGLLPYERDGIRQLRAQMRAGRTRALRFANVFGRLTLVQLEPVMRALADLRPFLVMRHDETNVPDLLEFTARFPRVPLILTEVMWGPCITVFDVMRRRRNVRVDTSWLHSGGAVELVVRHFGADRLVFGMGPRSHNGAAIAQLARADVTERERRLIAGGTVERLAGLEGEPPVEVRPAKPPDSLWGRLLDGRPLGVDVVDAHFHLGPSGGYVLEHQAEAPQAREALRLMKALGVRTALVSGLQAALGAPVEGNDLLERVVRSHTDRFQGYLTFNPFYAEALVRGFDRWFAGPFFAGFKTLNDYWRVPITDPRFKPMWTYAERHRLPVLMHTWQGTYDSPAMCGDLVKRYRNVAFIFGHSGGTDGGRREAEELAPGNPNVYLEWCGSFCSGIPWEETLQRVSPKQVVYGTDAMAHDMHWELGRLLSLDVPDETLLPILGANMRRVLARRRGAAAARSGGAERPRSWPAGAPERRRLRSRPVIASRCRGMPAPEAAPLRGQPLVIEGSRRSARKERPR
jgi:predicted TIM-barrel fold metal-dependent hydrolase